MREEQGVRNARDYYNSSSAEGFYSTFWGGEDLHIGIYHSRGESIREASERTVARMAQGTPIGPDSTLLDIGAGYGGSARYLSKSFGCRAGGLFIFTDPMQSDDADREILMPVLERLDLESLASPGFYRECAASRGLRELSFEDLSSHLVTHYGRVLDELVANDELARSVSGEEYVDRMRRGLRNWVRAGESGALTWGIFRFQKGKAR